MSKSDAAIAELGEGAGKRKRGSRNKKKNMRKVDISDVDKALETQASPFPGLSAS